MFRVLIWRLLKSRAIIIIFSVISFLIGLLLNTVIKQYLTSDVDLMDKIIQASIFVLLILLLTYISFQFKSLQSIINRQKLSVNVTYASEKTGDKQMYSPVNEAIANAKYSIRVIGMFRPSDLQYKEGRNGYYTVLTDLIKMKIKMNKPFIYERIVQVENVTSGVLSEDQIDPITFEHCKTILECREQKSAVSLFIKQIPNILGALSFLIVDNDQLFMVMPEAVRDNDGKLKLDGLQLGLDFTDSDGVLVEPMKSSFSRLFNEAEPVLKVNEKIKSSR